MSELCGLHRYTYADYVALEAVSTGKHEFLGGEIHAMPGGSEEHSALAAEMVRVLGNGVGDRPCRVHTSDLRVYVEAIGLAHDMRHAIGFPHRGLHELLLSRRW